MQVIIEVQDAKAPFLMELLESLPYVKIAKPNFEDRAQKHVQTDSRSLAPKTAALAGAFPVLREENEISRLNAIWSKHQ